MAKQPQFHGSICAMITPFKNGAVDEKALAELTEWHIDQGTHGLVPVGTTGESPTLSHDEHNLVVKIVVEAAAGRVPIIAGTGSNNTIEAIELSKHAKLDGADAMLVVAPYYNKPNQEGLKAHYLAVANSVELPLIVYNVPGRSVVDVQDETLGELSNHANIVGVKDATADVTRVPNIRRLCGEDFIQLTGEDASVLPHAVMGGHGCISVTANVLPKLCSDFHNAWAARDLEKAQAINESLMMMHAALFSDTSPQPTKYAMSKLGLNNGEMRLPLIEASAKAKGLVDDALRGLDL